MTLREEMKLLAEDKNKTHTPQSLKEQMVVLSGLLLKEEDSDDYIDDYEEINRPEGLEISRNGDVLYYGKNVGITPLKGEAMFKYKMWCPKIVIKFFKDNGYAIKEW